jgi:hypothetical protein
MQVTGLLTIIIQKVSIDVCDVRASNVFVFAAQRSLAGCVDRTVSTLDGGASARRNTGAVPHILATTAGTAATRLLLIFKSRQLPEEDKELCHIIASAAQVATTIFAHGSIDEHACSPYLGLFPLVSGLDQPPVIVLAVLQRGRLLRRGLEKGECNPQSDLAELAVGRDQQPLRNMVSRDELGNKAPPPRNTSRVRTGKGGLQSGMNCF